MQGSDRLGRLLFIVPYVLQRDGVPVAELARLLGVTPQQIATDVDLLCMVGQPPLTPDHLIDLYIEDDVVFVALDQKWSRPLRLTHEEARALALGAKWVGDVGGMQQTLDAALAVLMDNLNPADRQAVEALSDRVCVAFEAHGSAAHAATLRSAVASRRLVEAMYYSASSDRKRTYRLKPLALVAHGGVVYLVALDTAAKDREKLFRLDRLQAVVPVAETFAAPPVDLERFRTPRLYFGAEASPAQVWIAASRFEAVAEHFTADDILAQDASGTHLRLATDSPAWLSRWALQFGLDAQILAPPQGRRHMGTLCAEAAALYAQPPVPVALDAPQ